MKRRNDSTSSPNETSKNPRLSSINKQIFQSMLYPGVALMCNVSWVPVRCKGTIHSSVGFGSLLCLFKKVRTGETGISDNGIGSGSMGIPPTQLCCAQFPLVEQISAVSIDEFTGDVLELNTFSLPNT